MMTRPSKVVASLLLMTIFLGQISTAHAQATGPVMPLSSQTIDNPVNTGATSFRGGDKREPSQLPMSNTMLFQEPAYSGLMYQVHVLGEVNKPGTYRVPASTRLSEALDKAGGILERGSERRIEVRRRDGGTRKVDLMSFKIQGNLDSNPYLLENDVIFVPLKGKVVQIEGTVQRPGVYELKTEKTIEDLVHLAGGFTPGVANPAPVKIVRFDHGKKEVLDIDNVEEERRRFEVQNADVVVIPHVLTEDKKFDYNLAKLPGDQQLFYPSYEERVFVLGGVAKPGPYPFSPYYSVRQYLTLAGGATKMGKSKKMRVLTAEGKTIKANAETQINPGDTIIVPEKYMAPEGMLSLILGITTSVLGITTTVLTLTR